jgi:hypothetical protein
MQGVAVNEAVNALMARAIDYAGLFPPAGLPMAEVVQNYGRYVRGDQSALLGRIVVPASRLDEFARSFEQECCTDQEQPWLISVLSSKNPAKDMQRMERFSQGAALLDAIEMPVSSPEEADALLQAYPQELIRCVECAPAALIGILPVLKRLDAAAKIRTGGTSPEAIPSVQAVAGFIVACAEAEVPFKATAGLHHALRGEFPVSYEPGAPRATMHGFLNVLTAAMLAWSGSCREAVAASLEEQRPGSFELAEDAVTWQGHRFKADQISEMRAKFFLGFGSCSFEEPVEELARMGWL